MSLAATGLGNERAAPDTEAGETKVADGIKRALNDRIEDMSEQKETLSDFTEVPDCRVT